ncbi:hypothetical protein GYH30_046184 [Glycine max]|uniref:Uncharacterized protein n=1 Tax=Glycine max TaxID=3847 RepID=K7MJV3_SOYBN|nr:hypothetical protein GYH30_046184 [Glycine max]
MGLCFQSQKWTFFRAAPFPLLLLTQTSQKEKEKVKARLSPTLVCSCAVV